MRSTLRFSFALSACLAVFGLGWAPTAQAVPPSEVLEVPGVRLGDRTSPCNDRWPSLASNGEGFVLAHGFSSLRRYDRDRAAASRERAFGGIRQDLYVAPDGSGMLAYMEQFTGDVYARPFGAGTPLPVGPPLLLGTIPGAPEDAELGLIRLADGTYLLGDDQTDQTVRFTATEVLGALQFGTPEMVQVGDELWTAHIETLPITTSGDDLLVVVRRRLDGTILGEVFSHSDPSRFRDADLSVDALGRVTVAWASGSEVAARRFAPDGTPLGAQVTVFFDPGIGLPLSYPLVDVTGDAEGNRLISLTSLEGSLSAFAFPILADDTVLDVPKVLATVPEDDQGFFDLDAVVSSAGVATVALSIPRDEVNDGVPCESFGVFGAPVKLGGERFVLLRNGRFKVEVDWQDPFNGGSGTGHAVPGTEDAGSFWFFTPTNKEIEVKVLDGRTVNGSFWVFAAGLSNIGYQITVTDQRTGQSKTYDSPPFEFGNFIDTNAFPGR